MWRQNWQINYYYIDSSKKSKCLQHLFVLAWAQFRVKTVKAKRFRISPVVGVSFMVVVEVRIPPRILSRCPQVGGAVLLSIYIF